MDELLKKAVWNYKDIIQFNKIQHLPCSKRKAYEILSRAKTEFQGAIPLGKQYVKRDSVLCVYGLKPERISVWLTPQNTNDSKTENNG